MQLFPAIDLLDGCAVRLHQGRYDEVTIYDRDPTALAASWRELTEHLHLVDLEGARAGRPVQRDLVREIVETFGEGVQIGGGVRDREAIEAYLELGVSRVVLGTVAIRDPKLVREAALAHPHRLVIALDAKDGQVATDGWLSVSSRTAIEVVKELSDLPIAAILYTDISRDGTRVGPNVEATVELAREGGLPVLASGGVGSLEHLRELAKHPEIAGAIVGRAIYERVFTIEEAARAARG